jgi:hypothetical protein
LLGIKECSEKSVECKGVPVKCLLCHLHARHLWWWQNDPQMQLAFFFFFFWWDWVWTQGFTLAK